MPGLAWDLDGTTEGTVGADDTCRRWAPARYGCSRCHLGRELGAECRAIAREVLHVHAPNRLHGVSSPVVRSLRPALALARAGSLCEQARGQGPGTSAPGRVIGTP
jgi:hypothetical protein